METNGFPYSCLQIHWKSIFSHAAFCNATGNRWLRIQLSAISLEINGFAYSFLFRMQLSAVLLEINGFACSFLQFHWKSMVSLTALYSFIGNLSARIKLSPRSLDILSVR